MKAFRGETLAPPVVLLVLLLISYAPSLGGGFLSLDDPIYILQNPLVASGFFEGWKEIWAGPFFTNYLPLHLTLIKLEYALWGDCATGYRIISLIIHFFCVLLLGGSLRRLGMASGPVLFAAGLFALHPIHVESVAWISEQKTLLSLLFLLLSFRLLVGGHSVWAIAAFGASLLSKAQPVFYPLALVFFFHSKKIGGRAPALTETAMRCLPYLALAALAGVVALRVQQGAGALPGLEILTGGERLLLSAKVFAESSASLVWPFSLAPVYAPTTPKALSEGAVVAGLAVLLSCGAVMLYGWVRGGLPGFGAALYVFLYLPTAPVSGLSLPRADRYIAFSLLPLATAAAALVWSVGGAKRARLWRGIGGAAAVAGLAFLTAAHSGLYKANLPFWTAAVQSAPVAPFAHTGLGTARHEGGDLDGALESYDRAIAINPNFVHAHFKRAFLLRDLGREDEAVASFREALRRTPRPLERRPVLDWEYAMAHYHVGRDDVTRSDWAAAEEHFAETVRLAPGFPEGHLKHGVVLEWLQRYGEAESALRLAVSLLSGDPRPLEHLGNVLIVQGKREEGVSALRRAAEMYPEGPDRKRVKGIIAIAEGADRAK